MTVTEFNSPLIKPSPANSPLANPADPRRQFPSPFATYDFTSIPHEQLLAMLEPADPKKVTDLAGRLADASTAIKELGVDLKRHMDRVHWQGEGGDAFRDWGSRMSNATLRLGHYAENAGTWMNHAAATLTQVHNQMPKYSTASKATVDAFLKAQPPNMQYIQKPAFDAPAVGSAPSQNQAYEAQKRLHDDHMRAAELMKKLAESYNASGVQLLKAELPNFPPAPGRVMPSPKRQIIDSEYLQPAGAGGPQGQARQEAVTGSSPGSVASASRAPSQGAMAQPSASYPEAGHAVPRLPEGHSTTEIDSLPTAPTAPPTSVPGSWPQGGSADGTASHSTPPVPMLPPPGPRPVVPEVGVRPPTTRPTMPGGPGTVGARPAQPVPRISDPGVVGGRPLPAPSGRPVEPLPRGTVIGTEPGRGGGRPTGSYGPGAVGGVGRTSPGVSAGGAFTQGGTGLPRGGSGTSGMAPMHGAPGAAPQKRRGSQRPDYLVEDEETWRRGERRVVPPVIE
ncbi:hypothetical protein ACWCZ5_26065 [Streptomyces sp. NPDC001667]